MRSMILQLGEWCTAQRPDFIGTFDCPTSFASLGHDNRSLSERLPDALLDSEITLDATHLFDVLSLIPVATHSTSDDQPQS
jgi:hypothetical protein